MAWGKIVSRNLAGAYELAIRCTEIVLVQQMTLDIFERFSFIHVELSDQSTKEIPVLLNGVCGLGEPGKAREDLGRLIHGHCRVLREWSMRWEWCT